MNIEKLVERIKARPPEADFTDVRRVLEAYGYTLRGGKGSHHVFKKAGRPSISVPTLSGTKVKRTYLDQVCKLLELDD